MRGRYYANTVQIVGINILFSKVVWPGLQMGTWLVLFQKAGGLGIIGGGNAPKEVSESQYWQRLSLWRIVLSASISCFCRLCRWYRGFGDRRGWCKWWRLVRAIQASTWLVSEQVLRWFCWLSVALAKRMEKIRRMPSLLKGWKPVVTSVKLTTMTLVRPGCRSS